VTWQFLHVACVAFSLRDNPVAKIEKPPVRTAHRLKLGPRSLSRLIAVSPSWRTTGRGNSPSPSSPKGEGPSVLMGLGCRGTSSACSRAEDAKTALDHLSADLGSVAFSPGCQDDGVRPRGKGGPRSHPVGCSISRCLPRAHETSNGQPSPGAALASVGATYRVT
jgi:hypothetical protein